MSIATWYSQQYSSWNRNRRLRNSTQAANNNSQAATVMAQQNQDAQADGDNGTGKDKRSGEPLFGPSIGAVSNGPAWTLSSEKKVVTDELTQDIVNLWIEKSKESSQPTTTLQALVNLKRPTLRLSPLSSVTDEPPTTNASDQHHHGLEFEYDCDAPKCGIYVHVHLPKSHPDAPSTSSHHSLAKLLVFETVVDGGFANHLKLEEGALLELGRFEHSNSITSKGEDVPSAAVPSADALPSVVESSTTTTSPSAEAGSGRNTNNNARHRRFTHFHFRRRSQNRSISGPALAVVDAEPAVAQDGKTKDGKDEPEEGVKITIRLAALDEQGTELAALNEQTTYLHIVRFGQRTAPEPGSESGEAAEDSRPWVVKVVKREATIGPHTFHLHEIFGLTSSSAHNASQTETVALSSPTTNSTTHTYPPEEGKTQPVTALAPAADDEDPQSECLLCLSSPREVVLLPCRHLVACKDCALNMVEFGAGGNITQATEPAPGGDDVGGAGAGVGGTGATAAAAALATPGPPANQRRKRKAKGWFCPVCRQPYTSMLRLTTCAPPLADMDLLNNKESGEGEGSGTEDEGGGTSPAVPEPAYGLPLPVTASAAIAITTGDPAAAGERAGGERERERGGLLGAARRPGFLRGLSLSRRPEPPIAMGDVESQMQGQGQAAQARA
ncbi:hypothetical protein CVT25_001316 [Psilocybe cyanescens]|uniref:RING-type domain-containing protein n=1 Tax=Psilocybe cyanescens TaxID=93625 RepID=A0A409XF26_PSICY|nr:hypothetical protein CVT25_001316 [Psilocybe cyanescens]